MTLDTTTTTLPCPHCAGTLQRYDAGGGQLQHPSRVTRHGLIYDRRRVQDVEVPSVIWACNGCECCATDRDLQRALAAVP